MAFVIPFNMLALFITMALFIGTLGIILGLRRIEGAPFMTVFAGLMIIALVVLVSNVETDYASAVPSNTTETGGTSTCSTVLATTTCTFTDSKVSYSYINSTGHFVKNPDPVARIFKFNAYEPWAYMIMLSVFFMFMGVALQLKDWDTQ